MSSWPELVSTAVVGTERRSVSPELAAEVTTLLDGQVPAATAEDQLLAAAGVLGTWRRVGAVPPPRTGPLPPPAPQDERPTASARAVQLLGLLLDGHADVGAATTELVADWLTRCARADRRLPAVLLPRVMHAATARTDLRGPATAAGGPMLRWLATRNPAWAWGATDATDGDVTRVWAEGTREERRAALTALRSSDPARARALLEETWASESSTDRTRFVESLATGLSAGDEPFLEAALSDRSKMVRVAAAALLAELPGSALARRMTDRLRPLVTVTREPRMLGRQRTRLVVEPPDDIAAAAVRDGVVARGAPPGTGRRAWALVQIIGATPLDFWERELAGGPEQIVPLGAGTDELLAGWALAAARQRNTAWARQLLRYRQEPALLAALPPAVAHGELGAVLSRVDDDAIGPLLAATPPPWPAATSREVIARLRAVERRQALVSAIPALATTLDPATAPDVEAWIASLRVDDPLRPRLRAVIQALSLRQAIATELA